MSERVDVADVPLLENRKDNHCHSSAFKHELVADLSSQ